MDGDRNLPPALVATAAIGVSMAVVLGDRQLTIQTHMPLDETASEQNRVMDTLRRLAAREKAFADLPGLEADLETARREYGRLTENLAALAAQAQDKIDALDAKMVADKERAAQIRERDYEKFTASGRQGQYEPRGAVKQTLDRLDDEIASAAKEKARLAEERDQNRRNAETNAKRFPENIEALEKKIAAARALIEG